MKDQRLMSLNYNKSQFPAYLMLALILNIDTSVLHNNLVSQEVSHEVYPKRLSWRNFCRA
jgi:hypothetical protein